MDRRLPSKQDTLDTLKNIDAQLAKSIGLVVQMEKDYSDLLTVRSSIGILKVILKQANVRIEFVFTKVRSLPH